MVKYILLINKETLKKNITNQEEILFFIMMLINNFRKELFALMD